MKINNFLRNSILFGVFAAALSPLIISSSLYFPFITGKNFFFRIVTEIVLFLWLILAMRDRSYLPKKSFFLYSIFALISIAAIADFAGANPYKSFWSNYERMEGLISLIHLGAYFIIVGAVLNSKILWHKFWNFVLGVGLYASFFGALQILKYIPNIQGGERLDGPLGNSAYFGGYMLFLIAIAAIYLFRGLEENLYKWLYGGVLTSIPFVFLFNTFNENFKLITSLHVLLFVAFLILLVIPRYKAIYRLTYILPMITYVYVLYRTATRGSFVGLIAGIFITLILASVFNKDKAQKISVALLLGAAIFVGLLFGLRQTSFVTSNPILQRLTNISLGERTVASRFLVWNMAYQGFKENPILGLGQESFNFVFNKYYDPQMWQQEPWFDRAHNVFLDWLIAAGLLGFLAYVTLFIVSFYYLWFKEEKIPTLSMSDRYIISGLLVAYTFHNLFVFDNLISYLMFFLVLAYLHTIFSEDVTPGNKLYKAVTHKELFNIWASLALVVLIFSLYFVNVKPILASTYLIEGMIGAGKPIGLEQTKKAIGMNTFGTTETREQLSQMAMTVSQAQVDQNLKVAYFGEAIKQMDDQISSSPLDARYYVFMGNILTAYGKNKESIDYLLKAHELSPKKQDIIFQLVSSYANTGDLEKALDLSKEAYDLDHSFTRAKMIYAYVAIISGKDDIEEQIMSESVGDFWNDQNILNAYIMKKRYDKVLEIWKKRVEDKPNDPQYRFSLAASYLANNMGSKAIIELDEAVKIQPELKQQAQMYIDQIKAGKNPIQQ